MAPAIVVLTSSRLLSTLGTITMLSMRASGTGSSHTVCQMPETAV